MQRSPKVNNQPVYPIEKIIAVLSYFTSGLAGLICLIIVLLMKKGLKPFLRYHIFMSIFISILLFIVSWVLIFLINILGYIPFVKAVVFSLTMFMQSEILSVFGLHFSIITLLIFLLYAYLAVGAILGKFTYLPWVSKIISYNMHQ